MILQTELKRHLQSKTPPVNCLGADNQTRTWSQYTDLFVSSLNEEYTKVYNSILYCGLFSKPVNYSFLSPEALTRRASSWNWNYTTIIGLVARGFLHWSLTGQQTVQRPLQILWFGECLRDCVSVVAASLRRWTRRRPHYHHWVGHILGVVPGVLRGKSVEPCDSGCPRDSPWA